TMTDRNDTSPLLPASVLLQDVTSARVLLAFCVAGGEISLAGHVVLTWLDITAGALSWTPRPTQRSILLRVTSQIRYVMTMADGAKTADRAKTGDYRRSPLVIPAGASGSAMSPISAGEASSG